MFLSIVLTAFIFDVLKLVLQYLLYVCVLIDAKNGNLNLLFMTSKSIIQAIQERRNLNFKYILYILAYIVLSYIPTIGLAVIPKDIKYTSYNRTYDINTDCIVKEITLGMTNNSLLSLSGYFDDSCELQDYELNPIKHNKAITTIYPAVGSQLKNYYMSGNNYIFNSSTYNPQSLTQQTWDVKINADIGIDYMLGLSDYDVLNDGVTFPSRARYRYSYIYTYNNSAIVISTIAQVSVCDITNGLSTCKLDISELYLSKEVSNFILTSEDNEYNNTLKIKGVIAYSNKTQLMNARIDVMYEYYSLYDNFQVPNHNYTSFNQVQISETAPGVRNISNYYSEMMMSREVSIAAQQGYDQIPISYGISFVNMRLSQLAMYIPAYSGSLILRYETVEIGYNVKVLLYIFISFIAISLFMFIMIKRCDKLNINNYSIPTLITQSIDQNWSRVNNILVFNDKIVIDEKNRILDQ